MELNNAQKVYSAGKHFADIPMLRDKLLQLMSVIPEQVGSDAMMKINKTIGSTQALLKLAEMLNKAKIPFMPVIPKDMMGPQG